MSWKADICHKLSKRNDTQRDSYAGIFHAYTLTLTERNALLTRVNNSLIALKPKSYDRIKQTICMSWTLKRKYVYK